MCGRFEISFAQVEAILGADNKWLSEIKTGEIFPTDTCLVEVESGIKAMKWGIPKWDNKGVIINARQETLLEKPFFYNDFKMHRCIVYAGAFYEWKKVDKTKEKNIVQRDDDNMMKFAGLYKLVDGVPYFVIITQKATDEFATVHNRLPLMLSAEEEKEYLTTPNLEKWITAKEEVAINWHVV